MMSIRRLPPHLVSDIDNNKRCSACNEIFTADGDGSLSRRFAQHVRTQHKSTPKNIAKQEKISSAESKPE
jgi:hypothetical protein